MFILFGFYFCWLVFVGWFLKLGHPRFKDETIKLLASVHTFF